MSVLSQISISCPACNNNYILSKNAPIESELIHNIEMLADNKIQSFNANFHCSDCDYSFNFDITAANLLQTDGSFKNFQEIQKTIMDTNASSINNSEGRFEESTPDQTQIIDHDIVDQVNSGQQFIEIDQADWDTESSQKTDLNDQNYLPQSELTDTFKLPSKDYSDTSSIFNIKELEHSSAKFDQEALLDSSTNQEDYSKYAVENYSADEYSSNETDYTQRSRQQTIWGSTQSPQTYSKQDYEASGSTLDPNNQGTSGQTLVDSSKPEINHPSFRAPDFNANTDFLETSKANRSSGSTLMFLIIPVLITLAALSGITFHLENNLKNADAVFDTLFPSSLREPPAGLFILEPNIRPLVLESGDIVNVAQGRLVNKTNKTFNTVQIEGIGFSSSGQLSQREKILLGNPVSNRTVKLKTLLPSNIKEIQNKLVNKSIKLRPNSEQDFIFVFTEPVSPRVLEQAVNNEAQSADSKDMSSFALRIYAVR